MTSSKQIEAFSPSSAEEALIAERVLQLRENPVQHTLNNRQYLEIHREIFKGIAAWAGRFRESPRLDPSARGTNASEVSSVAMEGRGIFEEMRENGLGTYRRPMPKEELVNKVSHSFIALLHWRPFAGGSGTVANVFTRQVMHEEGYAFGLDEADSSRRQAAITVAMAHREPSLLRSLFRDVARPYRAIAFEQSILTGQYDHADRYFVELEEPFQLVRDVLGGRPGEAGMPLTMSYQGKTAVRRILTELNAGRLVEPDSPQKTNWFMAKDAQYQR